MIAYPFEITEEHAMELGKAMFGDFGNYPEEKKKEEKKEEEGEKKEEEEEEKKEENEIVE
jgi:hypothetical protein